jgi:hypothetical protein
MQYDNSKMRIRRQRSPFSLYIFTLALMAVRTTDAFGFRSLTRRLKPNRNPNVRDSERFANNVDNNNADSWSKSAGDRKSSPLQVRKRVRAVLQKARTRTGVENTSSKSEGDIVAEAASIGGLVDDMWATEMNPPVKTTNGKPQDRNGSVKPAVFANENLEVPKANGQEAAVVENVQKKKSKKALFDVDQGELPTANQVCDPIPFTLPVLTDKQRTQLRQGERIQEQARMGREGSGYVILDVKAPPYVVWECLLDFESYPQTIPTVRDMQLYTNEKMNTGRETRHYGTPSVTRAKFVLSKFRLNIAAIHKYTPHPDGDYMIFTLDKSCTNMVLKGAKGIWHTEENPDGREVRVANRLVLSLMTVQLNLTNSFLFALCPQGYTRVYLLCEVQVSRALPSFIVDYAADRGMPRATTWLKPQVEAAADLWLKKPASR